MNEVVWLNELESKSLDGRALYMSTDYVVLTTDRTKAKLFDSAVSANLTRLFYTRPRDPKLRTVKYRDGHRIKVEGKAAWFERREIGITTDAFKALRCRSKEMAECMITIARRGGCSLPSMTPREHMLTERC